MFGGVWARSLEAGVTRPAEDSPASAGSGSESAPTLGSRVSRSASMRNKEETKSKHAHR